MRAALYARFSTDKQDQSSIGDQYRICTEHARKIKADVVQRYADEGISGIAIGNRPAFNRMVADAMAGKFEVILVIDLSRLSRSAGDLNKVIDRLVYKGVRVIGVSNGYDSSRKGHKVHAGMEGIMGEAFRELVREKTFFALEGRVEDGLFAGGMAYGYTTAVSGRGKTLQIVEDEAKWVRWIFDQYKDGKSPRAIAHELNRLGVPSPRGKTWALSAIYGSPKKGTGILNNELYAGVYIWNRSRWTKDPDTGVRKRIERPREEWMKGNRPDLAIVPMEIWNAVRSRLNTPSIEGGSKGKGERPKTLLGGLLRCGSCGGPVVAVNASKYGCAAHHDRGKTVCAGVLVRRDTTELRILSLLRDDLLSPSTVSMFMEEVRLIVRSINSDRESESAGTAARLVKLEREINNLTDAVAAAGWSTSIGNRLAEAELERKSLKARTGAAPQGPVLEEILNVMGQFREMLADLPGWLKKDPGAAREALREILGEIPLVRKGEEVYAEINVLTDSIILAAGQGVYGCGSGGRIPYRYTRGLRVK